MAIACAGVLDIRPDSLVSRADSFATCSYAGYTQRQYSRHTTCRARDALLHLPTSTDSSFAFRLRGPGKLISSTFKISSDSLSIWILYSRVSFCAPRLFWRSPHREHYMDEEGIGSFFGAHFAVTLTMCVTVKENALKEERVRGRVVRADLRTGFVLWPPHQ